MVRDAILQALSVGTPVEIATESAGVSYATYRRWIKRGERQTRGEYRDFARAVAAARGKALTRWLAIIDRKAADGDWRAAAWKAEHAFPEIFGRTQIDLRSSAKVEVQHEAAMKFDLTKLTDEELSVLERILEKQQPAAAGGESGSPQGGKGAP